jgi:hypothetical protein
MTKYRAEADLPGKRFRHILSNVWVWRVSHERPSTDIVHPQDTFRIFFSTTGAWVQVGRVVKGAKVPDDVCLLEWVHKSVTAEAMRRRRSMRSRIAKLNQDTQDLSILERALGQV